MVPRVYFSGRTEPTELSGTSIEFIPNLTEELRTGLKSVPSVPAVPGTGIEPVANLTAVSGTGIEAVPETFYSYIMHTHESRWLLIATANRRRYQRQSEQQCRRYPKKIASGSTDSSSTGCQHQPQQHKRTAQKQQQLRISTVCCCIVHACHGPGVLHLKATLYPNLEARHTDLGELASSCCSSIGIRQQGCAPQRAHENIPGVLSR